MAENSENAVLVARIGVNTLNKLKVPLIFVPGVMGSRLYFPDIDQKWNPDKTWDMVHWIWVSANKERIQLHYKSPAIVMTDAPAHDLDKAEMNRGWEGVCWSFYVPFLRALNKEHFGAVETPVYAIGYDWRQSNKASGAYIAAHVNRILQQEEAQHCILFTHSMGGIATRAALKVSPDLNGKALGVIHVFQPVTGAAVAYRRFLTGATRQNDGFSPLNWILGDTPDKYVTIQSGLRGPTELLPTNDYHDEQGSTWLTYRDGENVSRGNIYDTYRAPHKPPGLVEQVSTSEKGSHAAKAKSAQTDLMQRVNDAEEFHHWLALSKHDQTWAIYSSGNETDMAVILDPVDDAVEAQRRSKGDGTVPETSAQALYPNQANAPQCFEWTEARQFYVTGVEHSAAFNDDGVQALVRDMIRQILG